MKRLIAQCKQEEDWKLLKQVTGTDLREGLDNYDIADPKKCDRILVELCQMIFNAQKRNPDHYGLVAACVMDEKGNEIKAVNFMHKGKRIHGELAAILKYKSEVGPLTSDCTIITTLSPCSLDMGKRYGPSCSDVINDSPVKKVYCGYEDPTNDEGDAYLHKNFHIEVTRNKKIETLCKAIADIFLKDPEYLNSLKEPVNEVNPNTLKGSEGPGLPEFRRWALDTLKKYQSKFDSIYIIGSWYGNLSLMIADDDDIGYDRIINVELDKKTLDIGAEIADKLGHKFIEPMYKDANTLDYRLLGKDGLVINQCLIEMEHDRWYENIPEGTMVLLTARNNARGAVNDYHSAGEIAERYPMSKILFAGKKDFTDPETDYEGYMMIGIK